MKRHSISTASSGCLVLVVFALLAPGGRAHAAPSTSTPRATAKADSAAATANTRWVLLGDRGLAGEVRLGAYVPMTEGDSYGVCLTLDLGYQWASGFGIIGRVSGAGLFSLVQDANSSSPQFHYGHFGGGVRYALDTRYMRVWAAATVGFAGHVAAGSGVGISTSAAVEFRVGKPGKRYFYIGVVGGVDVNFFNDLTHKAGKLELSIGF